MPCDIILGSGFSYKCFPPPLDMHKHFPSRRTARLWVLRCTQVSLQVCCEKEVEVFLRISLALSGALFRQRMEQNQKERGSRGCLKEPCPELTIQPLLESVRLSCERTAVRIPGRSNENGKQKQKKTAESLLNMQTLPLLNVFSSFHQLCRHT